jgi:hypothetical protein
MRARKDFAEKFSSKREIFKNWWGERPREQQVNFVSARENARPPELGLNFPALCAIVPA